MDLEELIPTSNIVKHSDCVRITNKKKKEDVVETNVELVQLFNEIVSNPTYSKNNNIFHAVCLTIEDIKRSKYEENCWKFLNISYRNVLIYGRIAVLNEFSRENRHFYTLSIDDETECIDGYLNKINSKSSPADSLYSEFNKAKSTLERRRETGINLHGQFYPPESDVCKSAIKDLELLQIMIENNLKASERNFSLGPLKSKALIYAMPFVRDDRIRLNIFDISLDDTLDLIWKRNINQLYSDFYFK